jgi:hypothetical protein
MNKDEQTLLDNNFNALRVASNNLGARVYNLEQKLDKLEYLVVKECPKCNHETMQIEGYLVYFAVEGKRVWRNGKDGIGYLGTLDCAVNKCLNCGSILREVTETKTEIVKLEQG